MEAMRQSWTDDHLDDLNGKVDAFRLETRSEFSALRGEMKEGFNRIDAEFNRVDAEIRAVRGEIKEGFERVDGEIKELGKELRGEIAGVEVRLRAQSSEQYVKTREEIARIHNDNQQMHAELHALQRTIVQIAAGTAGTVIVTVIGLLVTKL